MKEFISFLGALTLLFIGARLFGAIDWAWYWLISPLLILPASALLIVLIAILIRLYFFGTRTPHKKQEENGTEDLKNNIETTTKSRFQQRLEQLAKKRKNQEP